MNTKLLIIFSFLAVFILNSCDEDGVKLKVLDNVASNELQSLTASSFVLTEEQAGNVFQEFKWNEPDFGFPAGESYTLQIASGGSDFASAIDVLTTTTTSGSLKVSELNKFLLDLGFAPEEGGMLDIRVRTTINDNIEPVFSNVQSITVTPYATDFPPYYMIGDATGGWDLAKAVEVRSTGASKYETTAEFTNGGKFRFFASPSWDAPQYNWSTFAGGSVDAKLEDGLDNDGNFKFIGATGWYKINVDVKAKSIVMTATEKPALYMIGAAIQGWDLAKAVELTRIKDGVFKGTTSFTTNETFRFFTKPDWSAGTINYPYFDGGSVDPKLQNANDGDSNFKVVAPTAEYTITVDLNNLTIMMENAANPEPIYMIGDATGGWDLALAVEVTGKGSGVYETTATFTNPGKFRFFVTPSWTAQQYNWASFEGGSVATELANGNDNDGNFAFVGTTGSYKITVDIPNKTIVLTPQ